MKEKFNLNSSTILKKKFATELSGYSALEVDKYLDLILDDYRQYEEQLLVASKVLNEKNNIILKKDEEIERLSLEMSNLKAQISKIGKIDDSTNVSNE